MRNRFKEFVNSCGTCRQTKARIHKPFGLVQPIDHPTRKLEVIALDFVLTLPETRSDKCAILNVVCKFSKMIRITPIKSNISAPGSSIKFKNHIYRNHRLPMKIISDRDSIFMSKFLKDLFRSLGPKLAPSTSYNLQTCSQSEIANRKVEETIRAFANDRKDNCDYHLIDFEVAYNSAVNSSTFSTSFFINYGMQPRESLSKV